MELIEAIKKALNQITPAPWMRKDNEIWTVNTDKDGYHTQIVKKTKCAQCDYDLNVITNAPTWLASLIELVEKERERNESSSKAGIEMTTHLIKQIAEKDKEIESLQKEIEKLRPNPKKCKHDVDVDWICIECIDEEINRKGETP